MDSALRDHALALIEHALAPVRAYLNDAAVDEVMINGPDDVWIERDGTLAPCAVRIAATQIEAAIAVLARRQMKEPRPGTRAGIVDAQLPGVRIAAVLAPTSVRGASICIRKHRAQVFTLDDYVAAGTLDARERDTLQRLVTRRKSLLVAGGTGSGKTTFLNALIAAIAPADRVVTIEEVPELQVRVPNWVAFEANEERGVAVRDLVRAALRYRPDRILIGEVRGPEAWDLLDAANTGHEGCFATLHANSAERALSRFEGLVMTGSPDVPLDAVRLRIAESFQYVAFMERRGGRRVLAELLHLKDYDPERRRYGVHTLYRRPA